MTQELPNESDVYKMRMRYRDKVCFEKIWKRKSRGKCKEESEKHFLIKNRSLGPGMGQGGIGGIDFSPTRGLFVFFTISKDMGI